MAKPSCLLFILAFVTSIVSAQTIWYSSPDEEDSRVSNYEIIGKLNGRFIIYKNSRNQGYFNIYNTDMKVESKKTIPYLPPEIISTSFILYNDGFQMFYQYQKKNVLHLARLKFNTNAEPLEDATEIDTAIVESSITESKGFKVLVSENKKQIMSFLLTKKDKISYNYKSKLFNKEGILQHSSIGNIKTNGKNDFFSEISIDNEGNLIALWETGTNNNDNISSVTLIKKNASSDSIYYSPVEFNNKYLDDVKLKIDNMNHHYLVTSFYSKQKRGNVDGLFFHFCDAKTLQLISSTVASFSEDTRNDAKGEHGLKDAFNDYYLKNIVFNQTGGFLIISESESVSNKNRDMYNRWDYMNNSLYSNSFAYSYDPFYSPYYNSRSQVSQYLADNIVLFSYDEKGGLNWSNTIRKTQYDDINNHTVSYALVNTGEELHFLYNLHERNSLLLNKTTLSTEGKLLYNSSPMRGLGLGYDFLPRLSKQVGKKQLIIPCLYGNITCFAKIEF